MTRVLDVITYGSLAANLKPAGVPAEWPAEVIEREDTDPVTAGAVRMTEAEYRAHTRQHIKAWRAFMATKPTFPDRVDHIRAKAAAAFDSAKESALLLLRAEALLVLDEVNTLREWITSFKAAVAAATSLADLRNRVAVLDNLPQRTRVQVRNAIKNHVAAGEADAGAAD